MGSGIRSVYPDRLNNGFSLEFLVGYLHKYTPDEVQWVQRLKHNNSNKNEDNRPHGNSVNYQNKQLKLTKNQYKMAKINAQGKAFSSLSFVSLI